MQENLSREEIKFLADIDDEIRKTLKASRYRHSVSVANTAACLAMRYDVPIYDTLLAGLLHDCAKNYSPPELLSLCLKKNIPVGETERSNPSLLHGKYGAYIARNKFGVENEDILSAIRYHTTGRPGMTRLEKIIFAADYMEPLRNQAPDLAAIRELIFTDIDSALLLILKGTLNHLKNSDLPIDEMTRKTFDYYKEKAIGQ
ncbi:MAG: bis(5'-nucleosyl)-tetraphosphatase (symmetrical) YqeK [Lachnospiraceae bacterium]|nr:bis(5'-nucleosyl)-tetraphosphatase (symmetrical) YqeK [Lachnospiraceae bacterium]